MPIDSFLNANNVYLNYIKSLINIHFLFIIHIIENILKKSEIIPLYFSLL